MSDQTPAAQPGWYQAPGDPAGTQRYWDGEMWQGEPQPMQAPAPGMQPPAPGMQQGGFSASGPTEGMTPHGQRLATAGQRIGARLIDTLIVLVVVGFVVAAIVGGGGGLGTGDINAGFILLSVLIGFAYEAAMVALKGGTLGKLILGLAVVNEEDGTTPPGWQPGIMRWIPSLAGYIPILGALISLGIFVISLVWLFNDPNRQTAYDRIAKTMVIQTK